MPRDNPFQSEGQPLILLICCVSKRGRD